LQFSPDDHHYLDDTDQVIFYLQKNRQLWVFKVRVKALHIWFCLSLP
jgi:hypothetical protein